jgi:hypothetical protein
VPQKAEKGPQKAPVVGANGQAALEPPLIRIEGGTRLVPVPNANTDPYSFYLAYYHSQDKDRTDPSKLRQVVDDLNRLRRTRDVHAALLGYLKNHPKAAEPWMYELLAMSIEINQGSEADVKTSLNFAADLAERTHNPNHLVSVADQLFLRGYLERVGPLLDKAMKAIPHRIEPMLISIKLAQKTEDPIRMADTVDRLLSLGWPGHDEYVRVEAGNQVETLAKALRTQQRGSEADALETKLTASLARDLFVRLTWDGNADFDVVVDEPLGATASYETPRTVFGGSVIKNGYGAHPEDVYVCPRAFNGNYLIRVRTIWEDSSKPVTRLTLDVIAHEGTSSEKKETHNLSPDKPNKPVIVTLSGGRRTLALPYVDPLAAIWASAPPPTKGRSSSASKKAAAAKPGPLPAKPRPPQPRAEPIAAKP